MRSKDRIVMRPNGLMAFAGSFSDPIDVYDMHPASGVRNQPCLLKLAGNARNACSLDTHHLGEKFVRQRQVSASKIVHSQ
jgi:hypothetical protein